MRSTVPPSTRVLTPAPACDHAGVPDDVVGPETAHQADVLVGAEHSERGYLDDLQPGTQRAGRGLHAGDAGHVELGAVAAEPDQDRRVVVGELGLQHADRMPLARVRDEPRDPAAPAPT